MTVIDDHKARQVATLNNNNEIILGMEKDSLKISILLPSISKNEKPPEARENVIHKNKYD